MCLNEKITSSQGKSSHPVLSKLITGTCPFYICLGTIENVSALYPIHNANVIFDVAVVKGETSLFHACRV